MPKRRREGKTRGSSLRVTRSFGTARSLVCFALTPKRSLRKEKRKRKERKAAGPQPEPGCVAFSPLSVLRKSAPLERDFLPWQANKKEH